MLYYQNLAAFIYRAFFSKKTALLFSFMSFSSLHAQTDPTPMIDLLIKAAKLEREARTNQDPLLANLQRKQAENLRQQAENLKLKMPDSKINSNSH